MKRKFVFGAVLIAICICLSGCGSLLKNNKQEIDNNMTPSVTASPTPEVTPAPTQAPKSIFDGETYNNTDGLYKINLAELTDEMYLSEITEFGEYMFIHTVEGVEDVTHIFWLIDPSKPEVVKNVKLPAGTMLEDRVHVKDNKIVYFNQKDETIHILDNTLAEIEKYDFKGTYATEFIYDEKLSKMFYAVDENIYCFDFKTQQETHICVQYERDGISRLVDYIDSEDTLLISKLSADLNNEEKYSYLIAEDKFIESPYAGIDNCVEDDNFVYGTYSSNQLMYPVAVDKKTQDSIAACPTLNGLSQSYYMDINSSYIIEVSSYYFASFNIQDKRINLYNMKKGKKEYELKFDFETDTEIFINSAFYLQNQDLLVMAGGSGSQSIYVYKLGRAVKNNLEGRSFCIQDITNDAENKLTAVREKASVFGEKYGIEIYMGEDVWKCTDEYYSVFPSYNVVLIDECLDIIAGEFEKYPEGMINQISDDFGGKLKIFLAGSITGSGDDNTISTAAGIHSSKPSDTYICLDVTLTTVRGFEGTVNHELCHALTAHGSNINKYFDYDGYYSLNPKDFEYNYRYNVEMDENQIKNTLDDKENPVYFIDTYSKTNVDEDTARLFEYAMTCDEFFNPYKGNEELSAKLKFLSNYYKTVYDSENWTKELYWEKCLK